MEYINYPKAMLEDEFNEMIDREIAEKIEYEKKSVLEKIIADYFKISKLKNNRK
jgi:hypothetical protein